MTPQDRSEMAVPIRSDPQKKALFSTVSSADRGVGLADNHQQSLS